MTRRVITLLALVCAVSLGAPALATAAAGGTPAQAITDCNDHSQLTRQYSASVLRTALAQMPADVREYTDCFDVIERQLFKQLGNSKGGSTGTTTTTGSGSSFLPTWLLVVIVLLALAAITFGALAIRRRSTPGGPGEPDGPGGPGAPGGSPPGPGAPGGPPPGPGDPGPPPSEPGEREGPGGPPAT